MRRLSRPLPLPGLLTLTLVLLLAIASRSALAATDRCIDVPHPKIDVSDLLGTWYPMEVVLHKNNSNIYGVPVDSPCAEVTITPTSSTRKTLRLVWNTTTAGELEFRLNQKGNKDSAQFTALAEQTGSLVKEDYKHFGGTMQALKLGEDFLFATFCAKKGTLLSTAVLARKREAAEDVVEEFVQDYGLRVTKRIRISKACEPGKASALLPTSLLHHLSPVFVFLLARWMAH